MSEIRELRADHKCVKNLETYILISEKKIIFLISFVDFVSVMVYRHQINIHTKKKKITQLAIDRLAKEWDDEKILPFYFICLNESINKNNE